MKYAVIDIGTNSVRYMLAEYRSDDIFVLNTFKATTRLGEGLYTNERRLCETPIQATVEAVKKYAGFSIENDADKIICTATSAVRDAGNSKEFADRIKQACNIELRVLSGEEEALAGFTGALCDAGDADNTLLVDIGGGSTEIIGTENGKISGKSFECGCVRLKELFGSDYDAAYKYICQTIHVNKHGKIVWIGGTATAAAMLKLNINEYSIDKVHMTRLSVDDIKSMCRKALSMDRQQLLELCSFDSKRGEILPYGLMIMSYIADCSETDSIIVSEKGLMDGIIKLDAQGLL